MKTPSLNLFDLIKSMTSQEKKYFKQYAARYGIEYESVYIQLFDIIAEQTVYNEDIIKQKFANKNASKQLSVYKNYLFNIILDCLTHFENNKNKHIELLQLIQRYSILFNRRLYKALPQIYENIEQLVQQGNYAGHLLEVLKFKPSLIKITDDLNRKEQFEELWQQVHTYLETEKKTWTYAELAETVKIICNSGEDNVQNTQNIVAIQQHALLQNGFELLPNNRINYAFYEIHLFCDDYLNSLDNSYNLLHNLLQNIVLHNNNITEKDFLFASSRFLQVALAQNYFNEIPPVIQILAQKQFDENQLQFLAQNCIFQYTLQSFTFAMGEYNLAMDWWQTNQLWWENNKNKLSNTTRNLHQLNLIRLFFLKKAWNYLVQHINELISTHINYSVKTDTRVRIIWLITQYEMNNMDLLEGISGSVKNWLVRHHKLTLIEQAIIQFFKKMPNTLNKNVLRMHFANLKNKLLLINPTTHEIDYIFWAWLNSHINQEPIEIFLRLFNRNAPVSLIFESRL